MLVLKSTFCALQLGLPGSTNDFCFISLTFNLWLIITSEEVSTCNKFVPGIFCIYGQKYKDWWPILGFKIISSTYFIVVMLLGNLKRFTFFLCCCERDWIYYRNLEMLLQFQKLHAIIKLQKISK